MAWRCILKQVVRPEIEARWIQRLFQRNYYIGSHKFEKSLGNPFLCHHQRLQSSYLFGGKGRDDESNFISHLKELHHRNDPEAVIRSFESHQSLHSSPSALSEYVKALVKVDRLAGSELLRTLQRGISASYAEDNARTAAGQSVLRNIGKPSIEGAVLGTQSAPIHMVSSETGSFKKQLWQTIRSVALLFILISGFGALIEDKTSIRGLGGIGEEIQPTVEPNTKLSDVKGVDEAKAELEEIVHYLREPQRFTRLGGKLPKGVLLVGPPGTGKTMLARAIAGEAGVPFFSCSGSEFDEMYIGVGARRVRDLFSAAKKRSPCIIFIDEIDAIGNRAQRDRQYVNMTLNQLLVELDGFQQNSGVIVIAATNFSSSLDNALIRPGRFDRHVIVPNPDVQGRKQILQHHTAKVLMGDDVDMTVLARGTTGFSGADLANVVNMAAVKAAMEGAKKVAMCHFEHAKDKIRMGSERKSAAVSPESRRQTAFHEAGHALVAFYTPGALPIHKATIVPRGLSLGMVSLLPEEDHKNMSLKQMRAQLDVAMGGIVAEELIFGKDEVTSGSSNDLDSATRLARAMVTRYGMSPAVGMVVHHYDDDGKNLSSETRAVIEREVKELLDRAYANAKSILTTRTREHYALALALLDKETLTGAQVEALLSDTSSSSAAASSDQNHLRPEHRPSAVLPKPAGLFPEGGAGGVAA